MAQIQSGSSADLAGVNSSKQLLVTDSLRNRSGVYVATSGLISALAAAQTTTAALAYFLNPVASTKVVALRRVETHSMAVAASAAVTRLVVNRFSFTGTFAGSEIIPVKADTTMVAHSARFSTVSTGMTMTLVGAAYTFFLMSVITAAGVAVPVLLEWEPDEEGMIVLRPGEGVYFQQPDAGVASDPRRIAINLAWEEF